jgi:hypothetical protein
MADQLEKHAFPDGRVANTFRHQLEAGGRYRDVVRWEDMNGKVVGWGNVERVTYEPTLAGQYLKQRGVL